MIEEDFPKDRFWKLLQGPEGHLTCLPQLVHSLCATRLKSVRCDRSLCPKLTAHSLNEMLSLPFLITYSAPYMILDFLLAWIPILGILQIRHYYLCSSKEEIELINLPRVSCEGAELGFGSGLCHSTPARLPFNPSPFRR